MNQDLTGNQYPPPGFQPEGPVIINPGGEGSTIIIDATPTGGSGNAVASGGVFSELEGKQDFVTPVPTEQNPTEYYWDGTKNWRSLIDKVVELYEAVREERWEVTWEDVTGKPDFLTEESDPTVPEHVKALTETEVEALKWLTTNFPREGLTPGAVLIVGSDGETISQKSFGEMLAVFFPGLTAILTGIVSAPTSVTAAQKGFDVRISWTDIERTVGYYAVEARAKIGGIWGDWGLINQDDYTLKVHTWTQENIPSGTTDVGARVRYINGANQASAWTVGQAPYDSEEEVITETTYEIVPGTVRWWQEDTTITPPEDEGETTYEIVAASVRWWQDATPPPVETKPNPPVISVVRLNANTIDVKVADTNSGKVDTFEFNYREIGTSSWYTLKNDGTLNVSSASPLLVNQATNNNTWNLTMSLSNALFSGKKIESRVRTYVASVASNWSTVVQEPNAGGSNRVMSVRTAKINIQKVDGLWSDTESDSEGDKLAYYYLNGIALKGSGGSRIKFENISFRAGLLIEVSKVFLDSTFFDSWADYEANFWEAAINEPGDTTPYEDKIGDYCQHNFITY